MSGLSLLREVQQYLLSPTLVAGARNLRPLVASRDPVVVAVHVVIFQTHHSLRHLLRGVRGTRRRLEMVVRRVHCCIHLVSLWGPGVHHLGASLELRHALLHLKVGVGSQVMALLSWRRAPILMRV
jgi:hypothetical protein